MNQLFNLAANKRKVLPSNKHFHNNDYPHKRLKCFCLSKPRTKIAARSGMDFSEELSTGISTNQVIKHRPMHVLIVSIPYMCIYLLKSKWRNQCGGETNKENFKRKKKKRREYPEKALIQRDLGRSTGSSCCLACKMVNKVMCKQVILIN